MGALYTQIAVTTTTASTLPISHPPAHHGPGGGTLALSLLTIIVPVVAAIFGLRMIGNSGGVGKGNTGGTGQVVGIVGRMGSGKSYFAVRLAYKRLLNGSRVCTNFSMNFYHLCKLDGCDHTDVEKCIGARMASRWTQFVGWDQIMTMGCNKGEACKRGADCDGVICIIDEADLYAPSNKAQTFPDDARWKIKMFRKYHSDLYWITQHEDRVNSPLKGLTGMMYVCCSWFGGKLFTAKGYEPEKMRRKDKHIDRKIYRFKLDVARLYNTFEAVEADGRHVGAGTKISELTAAHNARQAPPAGARPAPPSRAGTSARCEHERKARKGAGWCGPCAIERGRLAAAVEAEAASAVAP